MFVKMFVKSLLFVFLGICSMASSEVKAQVGQGNLKLAYEAIEEGNDHEDAIASVEAGLGGNGESSANLRVFEKESSALLSNLRDILPKPDAAGNAVGLDSNLLHDLKAQALARLEKKVRTELEKETAALGPTSENELSPTPSTHTYHIVKQKLSYLSWSYSGGTGPADWGQLGFSTCSTGALQSPIDIKTVSASTKAIDILNIAVLDWQLGTSALPTQSLSHSERPTLFLDLPVNSRFADSDAGSGNGGSRRLLNAYTGPFESYDGHTFTVTALGEAKLFIDGATYLVQEMRTHTPSEHTVDGKHFDMELQIVHTLSDGGGNGASSQFVVVSVFFTTSTRGAEPTFLKQLADTIGMDHFGSSPRWLARYFSFSAVAGALRGGAHMTSYYKYQGSLTQPPCTEGVTWFVIKQPLSVSAGTLGALSGLQGRNNRPVQPGHNRLVEFTP